MDDMKRVSQRNLIFVVVLLVVIIIATTLFGSGSGEILSFTNDGFSISFALDEDDTDAPTLDALYTDILSTEYLDYLPQETAQNAPLNNGVYLGESLFEGEPCLCYLTAKIDAACVVRLEDTVFLFNMESADTTEELAAELLELSLGDTDTE